MKYRTEEKKKAIGHRIKTIREFANFTRDEFAKLLNLSYNSVWNWEHGNTSPSMKVMRRICKVTGQSGKWIEQGLGEINMRDLTTATQTASVPPATKSTEIKKPIDDPDNDLLVKALKEQIKQLQSDLKFFTHNPLFEGVLEYSRRFVTLCDEYRKE